MPIPYSAASDALKDYNRRGRERRNETSTKPVTEELPLDDHDKALIDAAWEKHKAARPKNV